MWDLIVSVPDHCLSFYFPHYVAQSLVFRRTWTDAEEVLKEKSFFILSFSFLSEFVIRQVQTNIY